MSAALTHPAIQAGLSADFMAGVALAAALAVLFGQLVRVAIHWNDDEPPADTGRPYELRSLQEWRAAAHVSDEKSRCRRKGAE